MSYPHTLALVSPIIHAADLAHLSACWSENFHIGGYSQPNRYRDEQAVVLKGTVITSNLLQRSTQPPERHPDDIHNETDMVAAARAASNVVVIRRPEPDPETGEVTWPAMPEDKILAFVDVPLPEVEELLGLTRNAPEDDLP